MSRRASPTMVGGFVIGALVLGVLAIVTLGGDLFLGDKNRYVLYFDGSIAGLQTGAPVNFRGVRIGSVADIRVELDVRDSSVRTPILIDVDPRRIREVGPREALDRVGRSPEETMQHLVERGLRARLATVSMVTGQAAVEFGFYPDTPVELVGVRTRYPELPTIPSTMEQISRTLGDLPIEEMVQSLLTTVQTLERLFGSPELQQTPALLNQVLANLDTLLGDLNRQTGPLLASLEETSKSTDATLVELRAVLAATDERTASLMAELERTTATARESLEAMGETFDGLDGRSAELQYELTAAMRELSAAARALRVMAESFERQPESLLRGKR